MSREITPKAEAAIADYLDRVDRGEKVDREAFIASHADLDDELRSYFESEDEVEAFVDELDHDVAREPADTALASRAVADTTSSDGQHDTLVTELEVPGRFGRYELQKKLGEGAMGAVFLARDTQLGRKVALKVPKVDEGISVDFLARFLREARAAATLSHPNICTVHDCGEFDGRHFISMEFVDGHPLSDYIAGNQQPIRQTLKLVRKLALALAEAHAHGVVHRDLKPDNVMVSKRGEPVVMDFGLARHAESGDLRATASGGLMGTPAYMSPEQVDGQSERIGPLSDQYSLGVVLYELLTGDIPFDGSLASVLGQIVNTEPNPPSRKRPEVAPEVEAVCLKMMAKQQGDRFDSMVNVANAIGGLLQRKVATDSGVPTSAPPEDSLPLKADAALAPPPGETSKAMTSSPAARQSQRPTSKQSSVKNSKTQSANTKSVKKSKVGSSGGKSPSASDGRKQRVEALLEAWKFREASAELRDLAADPELLDWVREKQAEAKQGPKKARANSDALAGTARQLLEKHDFAGAVEVTDDVPREFHTPAFAEVRREAEAKLEKARNMEFEIEQLLLDRQYDDLEKPVKKLLAFQPTNRLARKLQAAMEGTVTSGSRMDVHGVKVELDDLKRSSDSIFAGFLPIAIGVVVVFGALTWGAMHLLWAAPSLTAKFAIDAALLDGSYEFVVDGKERKPDEMQDGLKGMAAGVHEIVVKKDGEVVARVNVEIPADETPTIHITLRDGRVIVSTELPKDDDTKIAEDDDPDAIVVDLTVDDPESPGVYRQAKIPRKTPVAYALITGDEVEKVEMNVYSKWGEELHTGPGGHVTVNGKSVLKTLKSYGSYSDIHNVLTDEKYDTRSTSKQWMDITSVMHEGRNIVVYEHDGPDDWGLIFRATRVNGSASVVDLTVDDPSTGTRYHLDRVTQDEKGEYTLVSSPEVEKVEVCFHNKLDIGLSAGNRAHLVINGKTAIKAIAFEPGPGLTIENGITGTTYTSSGTGRQWLDVTPLVQDGNNVVTFEHDDNLPHGLEFRVTRGATPIVVDLTVGDASDPGTYHQAKVKPKAVAEYTLISGDEVEKVEVTVHSQWAVGSHPGPAGHLVVNGKSVLKALSGKGGAHFNVENGITGRTFNTENESYHRWVDLTSLVKPGPNSVRYVHDGYVPWGLQFRVTRPGEVPTTVNHGVPDVPTGLTIAFECKNYSRREGGPVRFSNDSRMWMTLDGGEARIWETETGDFVQKIKVGYPSLKGPFYAAFDAKNEKVVFTGSPLEPVFVYDVATGQRLASHALPRRVTSHHTLDIDSNRLFFKDGTRLMAMDLASGQLAKIGDLPADLVRRMAVNPTGKVGVFVGTEGRNAVRNMETGRDLGRIPDLDHAKRDSLDAERISNDGASVLIRRTTEVNNTSDPAEVFVADLASKSIRGRFPSFGPGWKAFTMDPTGMWLLTDGQFVQGVDKAEAEKTVLIWSASDPSKPLVTLKTKVKNVHFSISPDGRFAATVGPVGETILWRVEGT